MHIATLSPYGSGIVIGEEVVPMESRPMMELLHHWPTVEGQVKALAKDGKRVPLDKVRLGPPIPTPSKIWAAAGNYRRGTSDLGQGAGPGQARDVSPDELLDN